MDGDPVTHDLPELRAIVVDVDAGRLKLGDLALMERLIAAHRCKGGVAVQLLREAREIVARASA